MAGDREGELEPVAHRDFALMALETAEDGYTTIDGGAVLEVQADQVARVANMQYLASIASSLIRIADRLERIDHGQDRVGDALEELGDATRRLAAATAG